MFGELKVYQGKTAQTRRSDEKEMGKYLCLIVIS